MSGPMTKGKLTQQELAEMFGHNLPIEAAHHIWSAPDDKPIDDIRRELMDMAASKATEPDLLARIFRQRRRIRTRLTVPSEKWPLQPDDKTELEAINALLADIEKSLTH